MSDIRLDQIWNWLPAFFAVAQTEHLPTASKQLNVTASALSRSIRLLESTVDTPLFNRVGRNLVLNASGRQLLQALQISDRALESALSAIRAGELRGPVRIGSLGVLTDEYVLPAILGLQAEHPELLPSLSSCLASEANESLIRGDLDVAFYYDALSHRELHIEAIGQSTASVYCGQDHPLFREETISKELLSEYAFSVPQIGDRGRSMDGWPVEIPRKVALQITMLSTNIQVCLGGRYLTVLPDVTAWPYLSEGRLRCLARGLVPPVPLFAACKISGSSSAATRVIEAVRAQAMAVDERLKQPIPASRFPEAPSL